MSHDHLTLDERFFVRLAVKNRLLDPRDLDEILAFGADLAARGNPKPVQALLLDKGLLTARDVDRIHRAQQETEGLRLDVLYAKAAAKVGVIGIAALKRIVDERRAAGVATSLSEYLLERGALTEAQHKRVLRAIKVRLSSGEHRYVSSLNRKEAIDTGALDPRLLATQVAGDRAPAPAPPPARAPGPAAAPAAAPAPAPTPAPAPAPAPASPAATPSARRSDRAAAPSPAPSPSRMEPLEDRDRAEAPRPRVAPGVKGQLRPGKRGAQPATGLSRRFPVAPARPKRTSGPGPAPGAPPKPGDEVVAAFDAAVRPEDAPAAAKDGAAAAKDGAAAAGATPIRGAPPGRGPLAGRPGAAAAAPAPKGLRGRPAGDDADRRGAQRGGGRGRTQGPLRDAEKSEPLGHSIKRWLGEDSLKRDSAEDQELLASAVEEIDRLSSEDGEAIRELELKAFQRRYKQRARADAPAPKARRRGADASPPAPPAHRLVAVAWGLAALAVVVTLIAAAIQLLGD